MTAAVKQIADYKLEINDYFDLMMIWYRDVLYFKATGDVNGLIFKDEVYDIKRQAEKSSYNGINSSTICILTKYKFSNYIQLRF